jgi:hypothetical protein
VNIGALGVGPLVAGVLADWTSLPLTLPYVLFIGLGALALVGLAAAPETGTPNPHAKASLAVAGIPGTAAAATIAAFSATGLFAGLSGILLATTFDRPSHALAGATLFLVFSSGVVSQLATGKLRASRVLALGVTSMLAGLALLVTAVRLSTPSLALFLAGGALIGAGAGLVFKGTTGIVLEAAAPEERVAMTSTLIITALFGLSIPVVGAGVALSQDVSAANTVLGFGTAVALGVALSGWALLSRRASTPRGVA